MKRFILTGAPGAGKTSLIEVLAAMGHSVVPEAATDVIASESRRGNPEPWRSPEFIDNIIALQRQRQLDGARADSPAQFHDRAPVCTYALATFLGFPPSEALLREIDRIEREGVFHKRAFFIENLGFIEATEARRISFEDALAFESLHRETYQAFGYECVSIAPAPVSDRVRQILRSV